MYGHLLIVSLVLSLIQSSLSYFITVDAHAEECFFDRVEAGTKMGKNNLLVFTYHIYFEVS